MMREYEERASWDRPPTGCRLRGFMIAQALRRARSRTLNITVPAGVLARIDDFARWRGESRSGFRVRAAQAALDG